MERDALVVLKELDLRNGRRHRANRMSQLAPELQLQFYLRLFTKHSLRNNTMVRVKHRYLLATFLYPGAPGNTSSKEALPDVLQFNQPSSDRLDDRLLLKAIRDGVAELFGDYGAGVISTSLKSMTPRRLLLVKHRNSLQSEQIC